MIVAVDADSMSVARMLAVNCDELTNVVARGLPFQFTTAPERNPVPFTVKVNAAPPAPVLAGIRGWFTNGKRFLACAKGASQTVNVRATEMMATQIRTAPA